ncbi:MAG: sulfotransferase [Planctomycetota bacterium]
MRLTIQDLSLGAFDSLRIRSQSFLAPVLQHVPGARKRRFHAFCVGLPRSGTHSIAAMFSRSYASRHEPSLLGSAAHILLFMEGRQSERTMRAVLQARDRLLRLEMEAAHYLNHVVDLLVSQFPAARFILTLREPVSWLQSEIDQNLKTRAYPLWNAVQRFRYRRYGSVFPSEERALETLGGVYPLGSYLSYWKDHHDRVVRCVPADRLLVLRTDDLSGSALTLARFLAIDPASINTSRSHSGAGKERRFDLLASVEEAYVRELVEEVCGDLVGRLYPEQSPGGNERVES